MQKKIKIQCTPAEASSDDGIRKQIALQEGLPELSIHGFHTLRRSIDARSRHPYINLTLNVFVDEPFGKRQLFTLAPADVSHSLRTVVIVGAGPAGLFAALKLIESGVRPILLERGKNVRDRRRDLALLNKEGVINPESNYCFGEGGAGTYSDGKLYTRSNKRGNIDRILNILVQFGADETILFDAHPHIGTNKLPGIISAIREYIVSSGGLFLFEKKMTDLVLKDGHITAIKTADESLYKADAFILATGHSARDVFQLLHNKKISIEAKPFALGVRIEHPQELINSIQYHFEAEKMKAGALPPASYHLAEQVAPKSAFSFCMCPGGIIAPASTAAGELVVNGWSPSKRNNPFANSGIVVNVEEPDWQPYKKHGDLAALHFQQHVERKAFESGGGKFQAPAQRMTDFVKDRISSTLPACSYIPGVQSSALKDVLPGFIGTILQTAFVSFGKKMKGYYTEEAIVVATESRTSSPVRIPRDPESLQHPQLKNLYPCGEGAGYAGGIMSAAMDGEKVASGIALFLSSKKISHEHA